MDKLLTIEFFVAHFHQGPPTCLQMTVYEKKFMSEIELGGADVNLESLGSGGQIEEWVPLRAGKDGITWCVI